MLSGNLEFRVIFSLFFDVPKLCDLYEDQETEKTSKVEIKNIRASEVLGGQTHGVGHGNASIIISQGRVGQDLERALSSVA